jgi:hypothetical protein
MNRTVVLQPAKRTPPNTSRNKNSNTQLTEVCTISNSYNKVHKLGTKYQTTNEKYHTQTNAIVTEHNRERSKSIKIHLPNTTRRQNTSH